jgi:hypothetical protein
MNSKACWYKFNDETYPHIKREGRCYGFVTHTFEIYPEAAAIVEDDKTGDIHVIKATNVRFCSRDY